jgi:hypothetical protein
MDVRAGALVISVWPRVPSSEKNGFHVWDIRVSPGGGKGKKVD